MTTVNDDSASLSYGIKFWSKQFNQGRVSIEDDPVQESSIRMCEELKDLILSDRRIQVSQIAEEMSTLAGPVWKKIHEKLGMSNLSAR